MEPRHDYVQRVVDERGVRLIRLWFSDVNGKLKSFAIGPEELESAFGGGMHFDGSSIDGFSRQIESDVLARPDPATFAMLPWGDPSMPAARMFCDIVEPDGAPFEGDTRQILRRHLDAATERGFTFMAAPEMEYFLFRSGDPDEPLVPLDSGSYFELTTADVATDIRQRTLHHLETMGIPVEYSFHEDAPSQHEIDLRYTDALTMADNVVTFRLLVKEIAAEREVFATFMPKPLDGVQGSGMHTHLSLFEGETNAFHDAADPQRLSKVGRAFTAGLLRHAPEFTAITNQLVNSYKRLVPGYEAPTSVSWGWHNRSALIRVPSTTRSRPSATRIEIRSPDPACNPYLAYSVLLAAGLRGIDEGYDLPESDPPSGSSAGAGVQLPRSLSEALDLMEESELVADALGDHVFEWFLRNKRAEWAEYTSRVTKFELERYLPSW